MRPKFAPKILADPSTKILQVAQFYCCAVPSKNYHSRSILVILHTRRWSVWSNTFLVFANLPFKTNISRPTADAYILIYSVSRKDMRHRRNAPKISIIGRRMSKWWQHHRSQQADAGSYLVYFAIIHHMAVSSIRLLWQGAPCIPTVTVFFSIAVANNKIKYWGSTGKRWVQHKDNSIFDTNLSEIFYIVVLGWRNRRGYKECNTHLSKLQRCTCAILYALGSPSDQLLLSFGPWWIPERQKRLSPTVRHNSYEKWDLRTGSPWF